MKWDVSIDQNGQQSYSDTENLLNYETCMNPYAYCLPRYAKMSEDFVNAPEVIQSGANGFISTSLSDENGIFAEQPLITITFDRLKSSNGINMVFNRVSGDYANALKIRWYKDDALVHEKEFAPDGVDYFC